MSDAAVIEFSDATKKLGDDIVKPDAEGSEGTERLSEGRPRHRAGSGGAVMMAGPAAGGARCKPPKSRPNSTSCMDSFGDNKINVIKVVRKRHRPGSEGSQGPGRRRPQQGQGKVLEGRSREAQEGASKTPAPRSPSSSFCDCIAASDPRRDARSLRCQSGLNGWQAPGARFRYTCLIMRSSEEVARPLGCVCRC